MPGIPTTWLMSVSFHIKRNATSDITIAGTDEIGHMVYFNKEPIVINCLISQMPSEIAFILRVTNIIYRLKKYTM